MRRLGQACRGSARIYLVGGATAVLEGWRSSTLDVDLKIEGQEDAVLREVPALKEELRINVELASPGDFLPELPGWRERSPFINREGDLDFFHYDFYAQALAKIERGHARDLADVNAMFDRRLIEAGRLEALFADIEPRLERFPGIDRDAFRAKLQRFLAQRCR